MKINPLFIFGFLLLSFSTFAQIDYQARAKKNIDYLIRNEVLLDQILMNEEGVQIFASAKDKKNENPDISVSWKNVPFFLKLLENNKSNVQGIKQNAELSELKKYTAVKFKEQKKPTSIKGTRIVLDPGHSAHNLETAILERKFMKIKGEDVGSSSDIGFYEAELTWATAKILKKRLKKKGAKVYITRKKGKSSFKTNFNKWKKKKFKNELQADLSQKIITQKKYNWYLNEASDKDIFKYMNVKDLKNRVKIINNLNPDLTLMIHYNASGSKIKNGFYSPFKNNYAMAFTGGGFMTNELNTLEARINFLRLLLSEDLTHSIALSDAIMKAHVNVAKIPLIKNKNNVRYLQRNSVYADAPGVYCRNLAMTRGVKGAICFGESLMQDNKEEAIALNKKNYKEARVKTSKRIKDIVDAFEKGIIEYINLN